MARQISPRQSQPRAKQVVDKRAQHADYPSFSFRYLRTNHPKYNIRWRRQVLFKADYRLAIYLPFQSKSCLQIEVAVLFQAYIQKIGRRPVESGLWDT